METDHDLWVATFASQTCPVGWRRAQALDLSGGLGGLLIALGRHIERPWAPALVSSSIDLLTELLVDHDFELPLPSDPGARVVAERMLEDPSIRRDLLTWARLVNTSERTLRRAFLHETGLPFRRWSVRLRIQRAIALLDSGKSVGVVASSVGYGSSAAFVRVFRSETGSSPGEFAARRQDANLDAAEWPLRSTMWPDLTAAPLQDCRTLDVWQADDRSSVTTFNNTSRRTLLAGVAAFGVGWALSACGGDGETSAAVTGPSTSESADSVPEPTQPLPEDTAPAAEYPRSVEGAEGPIMIEARPERVFVSRAFGEFDGLLSLGVVPYAYGEHPARGLMPWQAEAVEELGGEVIGVPLVDGITAELLTELDPDLFVAREIHAESDEVEVYDTVGQHTGTPVLVVPDDRRQIIRVLGEALGLEDRAESAIEAYDQKAAEFEIPGEPVPYAVIAASPEEYSIFSGSLMSATLQDYGLPAPIAASSTTRDDVEASISPELLIEEVGAAEVIIGIDFEDFGEGIGETWAATLDDPVFQQLPAVENGRFHRVDHATGLSLIYPSLLSADFALQAITEAFSN